jgi:hypothetical protein
MSQKWSLLIRSGPFSLFGTPIAISPNEGGSQTGATRSVTLSWRMCRVRPEEQEAGQWSRLLDMKVCAEILRAMTQSFGFKPIATLILLCCGVIPAPAQVARPSGPLATPSEYLQGTCAVIVGGDDTKGVGAKDGEDFDLKLLGYVEWQDPTDPRRHRAKSVVKLLSGATHDGIREAIKGLEPPAFECTLLVFFYSGHGQEKYLKLDAGADRAHRVDRGELGTWLAEFQKKNPVMRSTGGPQSASEPAPVLTILQACHAGGFISAPDGLDASLLNPNGWEILMSSRKGECSFGPKPATGSAVENSYFVKHVLEGMAGSAPITGWSIFEAAENKTIQDSKGSQHPIEKSNPPDTTIYLHQ